MKISTSYKTKLFYVLAAAVTIAGASVLAIGQAFTPAKVATINGAAFSDPKIGVTRLVKAIAAVNTGMKPASDEITQLTAQAEKLMKDIEATRNLADPKTLYAKQDQLDQLKRDISRKGEDAQKTFERRMKLATDSINSDLMNALEAYAKKRGIDLVVDLSQANGVYVFNEALDITAAFIAEYNAKPSTP